MNRLRFVSILLMFAVLLSARVSLHAADMPVVFAIDASLSADALKTADAAIMSIAMQISSDSEISLIVFDNVVQQMVPLRLAGSAQIAAFEKTLGSLKNSETGNLAAGFERALDEVSDRSSAHLVVFARAAIDAANAEKQLSYRQWIKELLLPSAAEKGISITLISPETGADAAIVAELLSQPANNSLLLKADSGLASQVLGLISATGTAEEALSDATQTSDNTATGTSQLPEPPPAADTPLDKVEEPVATPPPVPDKVVNSTSAQSQAAGSWVRYIWYAAIALLAVLVAGLLLSQLRNRASKRKKPIDAAVAESAYLPLQATRQRPFRSHDSPTAAHGDASPRTVVLSDIDDDIDAALDQTGTRKVAVDEPEQSVDITKQRGRPLD
jgi:hypothetical protein